MSNVARQILLEINKPLAENLKNQFVTFLEETNQKPFVAVAQKLDWSKAAEAFLIEFGKLWNNMAVPRTMKKLDALKNDFADLVLLNIKQKLFYDTFAYLKSSVSDKKLKSEAITSELDKFFYSGMYELFRVFDYQYTLSSLHNNSDAKFMLKKLNDLMKKDEPEVDFESVKKSEMELKVFQMIDKELDRRERIGQRWSERAACEYYAKNELGYGKDPKNQYDLDQFLARYQTHKQKSNPKK